MPLHKTSGTNLKKKSTLKFGPKLYLQYRLKSWISSQFAHGQYRPELAHHTSGKKRSNSEITHFPILYASLNKCSRAANTTISLKANTSRRNTAYKNRLFSLYILVVLAKQKCWIKRVNLNKIHRPILCQ